MSIILESIPSPSNPIANPKPLLHSPIRLSIFLTPASLNVSPYKSLFRRTHDHMLSYELLNGYGRVLGYNV